MLLQMVEPVESQEMVVVVGQGGQTLLVVQVRLLVRVVLAV
jgi:hypothetical protein